MLEGFDKDWVDCGSSKTAYYTNIPVGDYTFRVMATNENGEWNDQQSAELTLQLTPPFYRSFTFYLLLTLFFVLLLFFVTYYFMERFQRKRLKLLVDQRTNELHLKMVAQEQTQAELQSINSELRFAKEQAESSDRLKTAFMNNISHEIRTPLNGILGFGQLMTDPGLSEAERKNYFSILKSSSNRLINTVTDFMDVSLITSGNQEIRNGLFPLNEMMVELYHKNLPACQAVNLSLTIQLPSSAGDVNISSDRELLTKVLSHLLNNAIKFTKKGSVIFGFEIKETELEFFVKDTGVGIDHEGQATIFKKFTQVDVSNTSGYDGSGLGLSIAKGFVELLGGRIWVESHPGEGSLFRFTLPCAFTSDAGTDDIVHPQLNDMTSGKPMILIAEDEISGSILLEHILFKEGIACQVVTNGQQAVDVCRQNSSVSLVLMDLKMPVKNGFEATREIKAFRKDLPIIAVTAFALSGDASRALEAGCDDYLAKPFDREDLLDLLEKYHISR